MKSKLVLILALLFLPINNGFKAEADINSAQAIFIYNFLRQIEWPASSIGDKYVIGILGESSIYDYLKKYTADRMVSNKSIEVVKYSSVDQISKCQVLFITYGKSSLTSTISQKYKGILLIGEKSGTLNQGAIIEFTVVDGKLRYKINEGNAKAQQLYISSSIVNMALKS